MKKVNFLQLAFTRFDFHSHSNLMHNDFDHWLPLNCRAPAVNPLVRTLRPDGELKHSVQSLNNGRSAELRNTYSQYRVMEIQALARRYKLNNEQCLFSHATFCCLDLSITHLLLLPCITSAYIASLKLQCCLTYLRFSCLHGDKTPQFCHHWKAEIPSFKTTGRTKGLIEKQ